MSIDARLLVVSCPHRKPIQDLWHQCRELNWPDCPLPIDMLSPEQDIGWNANLIQYLDSITDAYVVLMLDDHFIDKAPAGDYSENLHIALWIMETNREIGMMKLQGPNAASPEIPFPGWDRIREYDRAPHPFKRTNLVPTLFRRDWLRRLCHAVLEYVGAIGDEGRNGAIAFEIIGTKLTQDERAWPERMLGIYRPNRDGSGYRSLLSSVGSDGVREGHLQKHVIAELTAMGIDTERIPKIERFR